MSNKKQKKPTSLVRERMGQWSKDIGQWINPKNRTGTATDRRWYFGSVAEVNRADADKLAQIVLLEWKSLKLRGATAWPSETIRRFELMLGGVTDEQAREMTANPLPPSSSTSVGDNATGTACVADGQTVYAAMEEYEQATARRSDCSRAHVNAVRGYGRMIRRLLPDMPLAKFDRVAVAKFKDAVAARPITTGRGSKGQPISLNTVTNYMNYFRMFLTYLEEGGWNPGFNWNRATRLKINRLADEEEHEVTEAEVKTFSTDELRRVWNSAPERLRLYILLGLNTGATQEEIATLRLRHVHLDAPEPYIERLRNKTKHISPTMGRWPLWPETVKLLRKYLEPSSAKRNPDKLALLNDERQTLVYYNSRDTRIDSIRNAWLRCVDPTLMDRRPRKQYVVVGCTEPQPMPRREPLVKLSFKYLRKTTYQWIRRDRRFGTEVADCYSQHKDGKIQKAYSSADFDKVAEAVRAFRDEFMPPMFADMPNPFRLTAAQMVAEVARRNGAADAVAPDMTATATAMLAVA